MSLVSFALPIERYQSVFFMERNIVIKKTRSIDRVFLVDRGLSFWNQITKELKDLELLITSCNLLPVLKNFVTKHYYNV